MNTNSIARISLLVHRRMNEIVGMREVVDIQRQHHDLLEEIHEHIYDDNVKEVLSGSMREGFCMKESDFDMMVWLKNHHVIWNLSQIQHYDTRTNTLIKAELTNPGFALLRLLNPTICLEMQESCIKFGSGLYISSSIFKSNAVPETYPIYEHGPCSAYSLGTRCEFDLAMCLASKHWPPQAIPWAERCKRRDWPKIDVLTKILQSGCHFVAIGGKNPPYENHEWRLSFSLAEKALAHNMTHNQFLIYGLLKIFLNEVLNSGQEEKLLCSYFMKTAVFWEIEYRFERDWSAETFLYSFWRCYKRLMGWIITGYCPNFFIPENNMFLHKIVGARQEKLFCHLMSFYDEGCLCLLRSPSLSKIINQALCNPSFSIFHLPVQTFSEASFDVVIGITKVNVMNIYRCGSQNHKNILHYLIRLFYSKISYVKRVLLYAYILSFCQCLSSVRCCCLSSAPDKNNKISHRNKAVYKPEIRCQTLTKSVVKVGFASDIIYLALYHYTRGRYYQSLYILKEHKAKFFKPFIIHTRVDTQLYKQHMGKKTTLQKINEAMIQNILIPTHTVFPELKLELWVKDSLDQKCLCVSPYVLLHFLSFLCLYRLGCSTNLPILELQDLLNYDNEQFVANQLRDISWDILGICKQMYGLQKQALHSYRRALKEAQMNMITQAIHYRIKTIK